MKVALIGDVHANLPALEAVLADIERRGAEAVWNVGDFVGYGAFGEEVVARLREVADVSILGNYDRKVLAFPRKRKRWRRTKAPEKFAAFRWAYEHLTPASRSFLGGLSGEARLRAGGRDVLLVHGSCASDSEPLTDETPAERFAELAEIAQADVVVCGHSHRPLVREAGGVLFVGTGSVGRSEGGDARACYATLELSPGGARAAHHRVAYDVEAAAAAMRARGMPETFARMVREGMSYDEARAPAPAEETGRDEPPDAEGILDAARRLAERCEYEREHTRQVTRLALRLFDELAALHGLGGVERFWLHCGAMLHDIGWIDGQRAHHKTALRLILADETLPVDARVRRVIAGVARYHRKALPDDKHEHFAALGEADRRAVEVLAGLLRVADGLDRTHRDMVRDVHCEASPGRVLIRCLVAGPAGAETAAAAKKADLLERVLGRQVVFETTAWSPGKAAG